MMPTMQFCCPPYTNIRKDYGVDGTSHLPTVYEVPVGFIPPSDGIVASLQRPPHAPMFAWGDPFHAERGLLPLHSPRELGQGQEDICSRILGSIEQLDGEFNRSGNHQEHSIPLNGMGSSGAGDGNKAMANDACFDNPLSGNNSPIKSHHSTA